MITLVSSFPRSALGCAVLTLTATVAMANDTPMTAAEFADYVDGKTLFFGTGGAPYGVEKYLSNQRVQWSFLDGDCKDGRWYEQSQGQICFVYDGSPDTHCWQFFKEGSGLRAVFENDPESVILYEVTDADDKMMCLGPDVGV